MNTEKISQGQMIYESLLKGNKLTVLGMSQKPIFSMYGARRILDLKESGVPVQDEWVDLPNKKRIKQYFLTPKDIKRLRKDNEK